MAPNLGDDDDDDDGDELDLLVVLPLSNKQMGTHQEREQFERLGEELGDAVVAAGVGEYDGDEIGGGEFTLFFCGPDVERLQQVLRPLLKRSPHCRGAQFVRMVQGRDGTFAPQRQPV